MISWNNKRKFHFLYLYVLISSSQKPSSINQMSFPYLCDKHIYLQKNDLQSRNFIVTSWVYYVYSDYISGFDIKQRMTQQLKNFNGFQFKGHTNCHPYSKVSFCMRVLVIEMDKKVHKKKLDCFIFVFHFNNATSLVLSHELKTLES